MLMTAMKRMAMAVWCGARGWAALNRWLPVLLLPCCCPPVEEDWAGQRLYVAQGTVISAVFTPSEGITVEPSMYELGPKLTVTCVPVISVGSLVLGSLTTTQHGTMLGGENERTTRQDRPGSKKSEPKECLLNASVLCENNVIEHTLIANFARGWNDCIV